MGPPIKLYFVNYFCHLVGFAPYFVRKLIFIDKRALTARHDHGGGRAMEGKQSDNVDEKSRSVGTSADTWDYSHSDGVGII